MKSSVPWQVNGVGREARQTAREAARRAGMSIGEWLDSVILESAETDDVESRQSAGRDYRPYDQELTARAAQTDDVESTQPAGREHGPYDQELTARADETDDVESTGPFGRQYFPYDQELTARADATYLSRGRQAGYDDHLHLRAAERGDSLFEPDLPDRTDLAHHHDDAVEHLHHEMAYRQPDRPSRRRVGYYDDRPDLQSAKRRDHAFERESRPPTGLADEREAPDYGRVHEEGVQPSARKIPPKAVSAAHIAGESEQRLPPAGDEDRSANQRAFAELNRRLDELTGRLGKVAAAGVTQAASPDPCNTAYAELNQRLDELTGQLGKVAAASAAQATRPDPRAEASQQLVEVISKLDRRLDQVIAEGRSNRTDIEQRVNAVSRAIADLNRERLHPVPAPDAPSPLDQALIEIADRQRALDGSAPAGSSATSASPATAFQGLPRARTQELSGLEQQLRQINAHIETLKPCGVDRAIDTLRDDLAQIGVMLQDALPRKSVEAIEHEMRNLAERIDRSRNAGVDDAALANVERGLAEVRDALRSLAPAENLAGVDRELQQLSQKIDALAHHSQDPAALQQLENAITGVRGIVSDIASNDALASLSDEVRALAGKVDRATAGSGDDNVLNALEERIAALADALAARNQVGQNVPHELETVIKGLVDKIERVQLTGADHAALGHLEDRIATLVEKLDASGARLNHLEAIERALAELLIYLEQRRMPSPAPGESLPPEMNELSRDVADLRQTGRKTQESLEVVHGTLGHLVDRLAMIETDIRSQLARRTESSKGDTAAVNSTDAAMSRSAVPPRAATGGAIPGTATINKAAGRPVNATASHEPPPPSSVLEQAPHPIEFVLTEPSRLDAASDSERRAIDPSLPPDHPLEPGSSGSRRGLPGSPADRIAASEAALIGATAPLASDPGGKSNFIAAARRAAQAASRETPAKTAASGPRETAPTTGKPAGGGGKTRALIAAGSAIVIVIGGLQIARNFLSSPQEVQAPAPEEQHPTGAVTPEHPVDLANPGLPGTKDVTPSAREPAPPAPASSEPAKPRQSALSPLGGGTAPLPPGPGVALPREIARQAGSALQAGSGYDNFGEREVTGSINPDAGPAPVVPATAPAPAAHARPVAPPAPTPAQSPAQTSALSPAGSDKLPATLSGSLRAAAGRGDAAAQYEIAQRFAEGHGVPQNFTEAAQWFERAAKQGLVPARFRLGGLYEKGLGVKKNLDTARQYYAAAGEAGHAKALHNLAVLYAEGIDGKPDYATAARWFRKAADYGIADSQYNLAVLYARGIGVEQNLAEAYKWFALAAHDGDAESARKRDELGARLDRNSLTAAMTAVQAWAPQQQPEAAVNVKTPPGSWDQAVSSVSVPVKQKPPVVITPKLDLATPRHDQ